MPKPVHRSFRLTRDEGVEGVRVKPRVRRVTVVFSIGLILLALASLVVGMALIVSLGLADRDSWGAGMLGLLLWYGILIAVQALGRVWLTWSFVRLGWLTAEEAVAFKWMHKKYPPSCLEPIEKS